MSTPKEKGRGLVDQSTDPSDSPSQYNKPEPLSVIPDKIPQHLKSRDQWLVWKYVWNGKRWTKPPHKVNGRLAKSNDSSTWTTFDRALKAYESGKFDGVGFAFAEGDGLAGIDLDHCIDRNTGKISAEAKEIAKRFIDCAYIECSPSGEGLRIYALGQHARCGKGSQKQGKNWIEAYDFHSPRYLTVTGQKMKGAKDEPADAAESLEWLYQKHLKWDEPANDKTFKGGNPAGDRSASPEEDQALIAKIRGSAQGDKFSRLFDAGEVLDEATGEVRSARDGTADHSSLDMSLVMILLWWCGPDAARIDRIFRQSALMREKWDEKHSADGRTYGQMTIDNSIKSHTGGFYSGSSSGSPAEPEEAKAEATRRIPNGVQTAIWVTAQECGIDTKDPKWQEAFAEATGFSPVKLMNVVDACMYRQESSKFIVLTDSGDYRVFAKSDLKVGLDGSFPSYINTSKLGLLAESFAGERYQNQKDQAAHVAKCLGRISQAVQTHILVEKQFSAITLKVDMFAGKASTRLHDGVAHITLPHIPFEEGPIQQDIIDDFKDHWPRLDEFIDLLAASRFAASRKKAYLWLKADSDWGKGLLQSALEDLGLVVTLSVKEVETLMSGGPVGKMLADFKRAWILWFNEFKTVKSEIKMLEQSVRFSPKNLAQVMAEVYLKMFTSAEAVEALASHDTGVEDQFANRFSVIECAGSIEDRPLFMASKHAYRTTLAAYVAKRLNVLVEFYRLMGREAAANHGDEVIAAFHSKHGIGSRYTRLSVALPDLARQHLEWVGRTYLAARAIERSRSTYSGRRLSKTEAAVLDAVMTRREDPKSTTGAELVYIRTPTTILDLWLESEFGAAAAGKLKWKSTDFKNALPEPRTVRFGAAGGQEVRFVGEIRGGGALAEAHDDEVEFVPAR